MSIVIDDLGVRRDLGRGSIEKVAWADLIEVLIVTTDDGPYAEDVFYLLVGSDGKGCCAPQGDPGSGRLLERLQSLPNFDNHQVIEAMGSTGNARFVCWKKG